MSLPHHITGEIVGYPNKFTFLIEIRNCRKKLRVKGKPCYLVDLPPNAGRYTDEPDIERGVHCAYAKAGAA